MDKLNKSALFTITEFNRYGLTLTGARHVICLRGVFC